MKGFRDFILRGNVVELAVAVVIGAAFTAIVQSFVKDMLTPLLAAVGGQPDFSAILFTINRSEFRIGSFVNNIVSFLIVAAVIYFLVVLPYSKAVARFKPETPPAPKTRECPECKSKIPVDARRCSFCTSVVAPVPVGVGD